MALSMHSHSGQFCPGHAQNSLEECIQAAISKGLFLFGLTEHMPRDSDQDLYPEEVSLKTGFDSKYKNYRTLLEARILSLLTNAKSSS